MPAAVIEGSAAIAARRVGYAGYRGAGGGRGRLARGKPAPFPSLAITAPLRLIDLPRDSPLSAVDGHLCALCVFLCVSALRLLECPPWQRPPNSNREFFFVNFMFVKTQRFGYGPRPRRARCNCLLPPRAPPSPDAT
jgi:hypothetical protein